MVNPDEGDVRGAVEYACKCSALIKNKICTNIHPRHATQSPPTPTIRLHSLLMKSLIVFVLRLLL